MFSLEKPLYFYVMLFFAILAVSYFGKYVNKSFDNSRGKDEYELVKEYLLNDSPLYGHNKPKIWIHSNYEINARKWKSFQSRNTTDLNQPYLYLTIQSIINHCNEHFHICLIDDDSFTKLIPNWDLTLSQIAEPMRHQYRQIGLMQLLYYYGGLVVPNSFLCLQDLLPIYKSSEYRPVCAEELNTHSDVLAIDSLSGPNKSLFVPGWSIVGCHKNSEVIKQWILKLKENVGIGHFNNVFDFSGIEQQICNKQDIEVLDGRRIGIKTENGEPILINDLVDEEPLNLNNDNLYGILIPRDQILRRTKYQWLAVLPIEELLNTNMILTKYFKLSMVSYVLQENAPKKDLSVL